MRGSPRAPFGPLLDPGIPGKRATLFNFLPGPDRRCAEGLRPSRHDARVRHSDRLPTGCLRARWSCPYRAGCTRSRRATPKSGRRTGLDWAAHAWWLGLPRFLLRELVHDHPDERNHLGVQRGPARSERVGRLVVGGVDRSEPGAVVRIEFSPIAWTV